MLASRAGEEASRTVEHNVVESASELMLLPYVNRTVISSLASHPVHLAKVRTRNRNYRSRGGLAVPRLCEALDSRLWPDCQALGNTPLIEDLPSPIVLAQEGIAVLPGLQDCSVPRSASRPRLVGAFGFDSCAEGSFCSTCMKPSYMSRRVTYWQA
jgi:hypothetical protein